MVKGCSGEEDCEHSEVACATGRVSAHVLKRTGSGRWSQVPGVQPVFNLGKQRPTDLGQIKTIHTSARRENSLLIAGLAAGGFAYAVFTGASAYESYAKRKEEEAAKSGTLGELNYDFLSYRSLQKHVQPRSILLFLLSFSPTLYWQR